MSVAFQQPTNPMGGAQHGEQIGPGEDGPTCYNVVPAKSGKLVLFRRDEDGITTAVHDQPPCFWVEAGKLTRRMRDQLMANRACLRIVDEGAWERVEWRDVRVPGQLPLHVAAAKWVEQACEVQTFEADVHPVRRWITDARPVLQRPRRCYLDIEADSRVPFTRKLEARVLCWSIVDDDGVLEQGMLDEDTDEDERVLITELFIALLRYDMVMAWYGDGYDFPVIAARAKKHGIPVVTPKWLWLDQLVVFRRMNSQAADKGDEKQSYALNEVGQAFLGEGKLDLDASKSWEEWSAGGSRRDKLLEYNAQDVILQAKLERKTGYVDLFQSVCEATHTLPNTTGVQPMVQVEGFLLRLGRDRGMHFKTHFRDENVEREKYRGAFVQHPKAGMGIIDELVHVADFSKLYPSAILTWNLSPETYRPDVRLREDVTYRPSYLSHIPAKQYPLPEGHCAVPLTESVFANEPRGILPIALEEMIRLRKHWSALQASLTPGTTEWVDAGRKSKSYKVAANSFYGVMGTPYSRFFEVAVAEGTAQVGVHVIKATIAEGEKWRVPIKTIYGDTDSAFAKGVSVEEFAAFVEHCNAELYPRLVKDAGCPPERNAVELAYEKAFRRLVLVTAKCYVGAYAHYKGTEAGEDSEPEVRGLAYRRGDSIKLGRDMQWEAIKLLMRWGPVPTADEFEEMIARWRSLVLEGELTLRQVQQSKSISKPLHEYAMRSRKDGTSVDSAAHVAVAKLLRKRGQDVTPGTRIAYVVVDASVSPMKCIPAQDFDGTFDRYYLWENLVYPPTQRLLEAAYPGDLRFAAQLKARPAKPRAMSKPKTKKEVGDAKAKRSSGKSRAKERAAGDLFGGE